MKQLLPLAMSAAVIATATSSIPKCTGCFPPDVRTVAIVMHASIVPNANFDR